MTTGLLSSDRQSGHTETMEKVNYGMELRVDRGKKEWGRLCVEAPQVSILQAEQCLVACMRSCVVCQDPQGGRALAVTQQV